MNRLAIYVFWEREGIVREHVVTYLKGLNEVASKIYVVVNGEIQPAGKQRLHEECGAIVLQRPNEGVDFWAYKTGIDHEGKGISEFDEVILCNCSCYGPVYPFSEMFDEMGKRDVDFWGITEWPLDADGFKGTWILSYFFVFRPHLFLSLEWAKYWKNLSKVYSRMECILEHETKFTAYFADRGFTYDVYCPNLPGYLDLTIEAPDELVIEQRCPLIKRKAFCVDYERYLSYHRGNASRRLIDYLQTNNLYDVNIILDDLLATQHWAYVKDCLQLNYILSSDRKDMPALSQNPKVAAFFYMTHEELLDESFCYLQSLPDYADVYAVASTQTLSELIREKASAYGISGCHVSISKSAGDAIGALLRTAKESLMGYDYICAIHDTQLPDPPVGHISEEIRRFNSDAVLYSSDYVENILSTFEKNPRLGMLVPMNALHESYCGRYGQEWGLSYESTVDLLARANLTVPIAPNVPPIAPMEAIFWIRPICIQHMLELGIKDDEFQEGNGEGTLYQVLIRSFPFFVQAAGYMTGQVISREGAENHITNLSYLLRRANIADMGGKNVVYVTKEVNIGLKRSFKEYLKKHLPGWMVNMLRKLNHASKNLF